MFLTTLKFSPVRKDRLFYNQYQYHLGFYLDEVNCLRVLSHAHIDDMIERRKQWREIAQQRWKNGSRNFGTIMGRRWKEITEKTKEDLHTLAEVLLRSSADYKLVVSINQGHVYTNDLELLNLLDQLPELAYKYYTQADVVRPKDTVQLKKVLHQFRTYLASCKMTEQEKEALGDFLVAQQDLVRVSPALQRWIDQPFNRTQDYFFVDHDTANWTTMLNLIKPGLVRKTMHIIPAK